MKLKVLLLYLMLPATLFASLNPSLVRQAEADFEAKEYEKAIELFQTLLKENPHHWQKERLLYNIATAYLRLENFEKASEIYERIGTSFSHPDPLFKPLKTNQALAAFLRAEKLLSQNELTQEDEEKAVFLLKEALKEIKTAKKFGCLFDQFIGKTACQEDPALFALQKSAKKHLNAILQKNPEAGSLNYILKPYEEALKNKSEPKDPKEALETMIFFESGAIKLRRMKHEMDHPDDHLNTLLKQSEAESLQAASIFLTKVLEKEKELFSAECQCRPWDQVIPLFEKGKKSAENARAYRSLYLILEEQEKAVKFWKQALKKLTQQNQKGAPELKTQNEQKPRSHLQKLLSELQQMDQQDRMPSSRKKVFREGLKPW